MAWRNGAGWRRIAAAVAVTAAAVIGLPATGPASADRGDLDVTFAGTGQVVTGVPAATGRALAVDPTSGRVYLATIAYTDETQTEARATVTAYTAAGVPDPTFGVGGSASTGVPASSGAGVDVALSPDGQRVYLGTYASDGAFAGQSYVAAFTAAGALDGTFSADGLAPTGVTVSLFSGHALAVDPTTGRVHLASTEVFDPLDTTGFQYIAAFAPDGSLDPEFGEDGISVALQGSVYGRAAIAVDAATSRLYYVGSFGPSALGALVAIEPDGVANPDFGVVRMPFNVPAAGQWGLALSPTGDRVYVASYELPESGPRTPTFVAAVTDEGDFDATFGAAGIARAPYAGDAESAQSLAVDPADGTVFLTTFASDGPFAWLGVYVVAFTPAGFVDPTFGESGVASPGESPDGATLGSALDPATGRLYVTHWTGTVATGTLLSAFQIPPDPTLSIDDITVAEGTGGGPTSFTFTVSLDAAARSDVTFDIATADNTATVSDNDYVPNSLTGQTIPGGASSSTFTVLVDADAESEGNESFFVNVTNISGARIGDTAGEGTIVDDDTPGEVSITPTSGLTTTEAGGTASFVVTLSQAVLAPVTVQFATSDPTEGTVGPASLTFDSSNWDTPQTATVTGADDTVADGDIAYTIVTTLDTTDPRYAAVDPPDVSATNVDDGDVAGVTVTPSTGLTVTEGGGSASVSLVLTSEPTADVVITLASDDPSEATVSPATITFTPANWNVVQTVTVTGVDDGVVDGPVAFTLLLTVTSTDPAYANVAPEPAPAVNEDDDVAPPSTPAPTTPPDVTDPPGSTTPPPAPTPAPTLPPTIPDPVTDLPATGGSPLTGLALAAGLLAVGVTALLGARTRIRTRSLDR
jgi:hypothetical protein